MELTILGAGTAVPTPHRSAAGVLVRVGETALLFDMGPGTLARLAEAGVSYRDLEYIFLTHLHSDHTLDLVTFLQVNESTPGWTWINPAHLTGCQGLKNLYEQLMSAYTGFAPKSYALEIHELGAERVEFAEWSIETAFTHHTRASLAYRLQADGKAIVYTGDTVECDDLKRLARGADVLICECAFPRGWNTLDHMTADAVGRVAGAAQVRRLVLTHLYPPAQTVDIAAQVREAYGGEIIIALDGTRILV